jgi:hypothetical protein
MDCRDLGDGNLDACAPTYSLTPPCLLESICVNSKADTFVMNRLLTQSERILEINGLEQVTKAVVEAARESLVIGEA